VNYSIATRRRILANDEPAWITNHKRAKYVRNLIVATPEWADRKKMRLIYAHAKRWGKVVDHIVPITHPLVCGLNVPDNLRAIPSLENAQRSNRWRDWTDDMFQFPEQLRFW
jgi:hypothetical protein